MKPLKYSKEFIEILANLDRTVQDLDNRILEKDLADKDTCTKTLGKILDDNIGFDVPPDDNSFNHLEGTGSIPEDKQRKRTIEKIKKKIAKRRKDDKR